jgi:hypothetical protein
MTGTSPAMTMSDARGKREHSFPYLVDIKTFGEAEPPAAPTNRLQFVGMAAGFRPYLFRMVIILKG